jgi:hypothetical protein
VGLTLVLAIRLTVPLTIVRWPLAGGLLSIAADTIDILLFDLFGFPSVANYQQIDKILDCYYLAIEFLVVQRWETLPRSVASALFAYRVAGVVLFELSDARALLLVFPNLFELFFLFVLVVRHSYPAYILDLRRTVMWLHPAHPEVGAGVPVALRTRAR